MRIEFDALGGKEVGGVLVAAGDVVDATVDEHVDAAVQVGPVVRVAQVVLWQPLSLQQLTLRGARVFNYWLNERD